MDNRGNIVVTLLFMMLLSISGLALLTHTDFHLKVVGARSQKRLASAALEQALLLNLHRYREKLAVCDMNAFQEPEKEFFNRETFPDVADDGWLCRHRFSGFALRSGEGFRVVRVLDYVRTSRASGRLEYSACASVELVAGDIPVGEFGLLVARRSEEDAAAFLAARGVAYAGTQLPLVGDFPASSETNRLLCETLGLPVQVPDWRSIREKINLEPSDAPVPRGIYLVQDGAEVTAVFIEGDLQKLEFGAGDAWQSIAFNQDGRTRILRYQPALGSMTWSGEENAGGLLFKEKIIVHGSVWDIAQAGTAAFLSASRIELLASGRLVVRSGLVSENLALAAEKFPNLLLMTSDRDFFSGETVDADVVMDMEGDNTVQAQVIAAGALVNGNAHVEITGGLFAGDIENSGRLWVDGAAGGFGFGSGFRLPGFKFLRNFRVHFIEEGSDGE